MDHLHHLRGAPLLTAGTGNLVIASLRSNFSGVLVEESSRVARGDRTNSVKKRTTDLAIKYIDSNRQC